MNKENLKRICFYNMATSNEIIIDEYSLTEANLHSEIIGYIPRPMLWLNYAREHPYFFKSLWKLAWIIWRHIGFFVFYSIKLINYATNCILNKKRLSEMKNHRIYMIGFSQKAYDILESRLDEKIKKCWISVPWVKRKPNNDTYNIFSILTINDLIKCYYLSITAHLIFSKKRSRLWSLQTYTAFDWFATLLALEKIPGHFAIAEHYDRWAVLCDALISNKRKNGFHVELTLVQHGIVTRIVNQESFPYHLKYKLRNIDRLFIYDEMSEKIFKDRILSRILPKKQISTKYFRSKIKITKTKSNKKITLLFIGHPQCEDLHIYLLQELSKKYDIDAYYKPHPLVKGNQKKLQKHQWMIITDVNFFPSITLIISYPSTLVIEYQDHGVLSFTHPLGNKKDSYLSDIDKIIKSLVA